jgi:hypothetical protein
MRKLMLCAAVAGALVSTSAMARDPFAAQTASLDDGYAAAQPQSLLPAPYVPAPPSAAAPQPAGAYAAAPGPAAAVPPAVPRTAAPLPVARPSGAYANATAIPTAFWAMPLPEPQRAAAVAPVQERLKALSCYGGKIDGVEGRGTATAIKRWQAANGAPQTGVLSEPLMKSVLTLAYVSAPCRR